MGVFSVRPSPRPAFSTGLRHSRCSASSPGHQLGGGRQGRSGWTPREAGLSLSRGARAHLLPQPGQGLGGRDRTAAAPSCDQSLHWQRSRPRLSKDSVSSLGTRGLALPARTAGDQTKPQPSADPSRGRHTAPFPPHLRPLLVPHRAQDEGWLPGPGDVHQVLQLCGAQGCVGRGWAGASPPPKGPGANLKLCPHPTSLAGGSACCPQALCSRNS